MTKVYFRTFHDFQFRAAIDISKHSYAIFCVDGSVGNFVSRTIITGGQSSKVAHFLYGFSAGFGVCGGGGGGAHA